MRSTNARRQRAWAALTALAVVCSTMGFGALPASAQAPVVEATASLSGTVSDLDTAAPLVDVSVVVLDASGAEAGSTVSGTSGGYTIGGLAPGAYRLSYSLAPTHAPRFWPAVSAASDAEPIILAEAEARTGLDVALPALPASSDAVTSPTPDNGSAPSSSPTADNPIAEGIPDTAASSVTASETASVAGTIADEKGIPIEGARVSIIGDGGLGSALTVTEGAYLVEGLEAGADYSISVSADGFVSHDRSIEVTGDLAGIDVKLAAAEQVAEGNHGFGTCDELVGCADRGCVGVRIQREHLTTSPTRRSTARTRLTGWRSARRTSVCLRTRSSASRGPSVSPGM